MAPRPHLNQSARHGDISVIPATRGVGGG
jgi:hypothetical protein